MTRPAKALVTGAGQGIGLATALVLAARGVQVLASTRTEAKLKNVSHLPDSMQTAALDCTDRAAVFDIVARFGPFDILCNCSGWVHTGTILDCSEEDWRKSFDENVTAFFHAIQAVLPGMIAKGAGSIVNVSSAASSVRGFPARSAYGASKAGVIGLTKSVARDFVGHGVRCNAVCPGPIDSPSMAERLAATGNADAARQRYVTAQPMGRFGTPDEVAAAMAFFALDATFTSGAILVMDGGM